MIPKEHIIEWKNTVPWNDFLMVEQDLLISKSLVLIYSDSFLATHLGFRGGTALHKLYLSPQLRYSEDIDLVQLKAENIGVIIDRLREVLSYLGAPIVKQKRNNNTLVFKVSSTFNPSISIRLKIEINCKEHFSVLGLNEIPFEVKNSWFNGSCKIITYHLDELIGTKLRALYQRKKGRDLFDLFIALRSPTINSENVLKCYREYMSFSEGSSPSSSLFILNLEEKIKEEVFLNDIKALLRPTIKYNAIEAFEFVKSTLIEKI